MSNDNSLTVYLIRHGETLWNREGRCQGVTDVPLTEKGYSQAQAIARVLAEKPLRLILSSSLQRGKETASIIARPHGLQVDIRNELKEWNQGELEGLTGMELLGRHQAYFERWRKNPGAEAPPGGETLASLQNRAWPVIDRLRDLALDGPVAVVSHAMTLNTILCAALGLDLANVHRLKLDIASRSTLKFSSLGIFSSWIVTSLNDRNHLNDHLRD
jgi:broad specificity phosphatase PhoE